MKTYIEKIKKKLKVIPDQKPTVNFSEIDKNIQKIKNFQIIINEPGRV
jgi:hypothetical protein